MLSIESPFKLLKFVLASLPLLLLGLASADAEATAYADEATFKDAMTNLAVQDVFYENCHGQRPQYRERFDALVTQAHPGLRDELLGNYDTQHRMLIQMYAAMRGNPCSPAMEARIEQTAAKAFATLEPGAGATGSTEAASPKDPQGSTTVAPESAPASGAFDAAIARAKSHRKECMEIRSKHGHIVSASDFGAGRRANAMPNAASNPSSRRKEVAEVANDCVEKCLQAWQALDRSKERPDSSLTQEDADQYIAACDSSYELAVAKNAGVAPAEDADREAKVASAEGGDPVASIERFFGEFSDWDIRIEADAFSGGFDVGFARQAQFSIKDIHLVEARAGHGKSWFIFFRCRDRANCIKIEEQRGDRATAKEAFDLSVNTKRGTANSKSRERLSSLGIDIERWARSVGASIDVSF